jgi:hypothetical protein
MSERGFGKAMAMFPMNQGTVFGDGHPQHVALFVSAVVDETAIERSGETLIAGTSPVIAGGSGHDAPARVVSQVSPDLEP